MRNYDIEKEMSSRAEFDLIKNLVESDYIIKAEEFISTERWTYTVMEYAPGIELQEFVFTNFELS